MTNSYIVKRLLIQASVTVLAGLLMSSAMLAEDIATEGEDGSILVDVTFSDRGSPVCQCGAALDLDQDGIADTGDEEVTPDDGEVAADPVDEGGLHPTDPLDDTVGEEPAEGLEPEAVPEELLQNNAPSVTGAEDGATNGVAPHAAQGSDHDGLVPLIFLSN